MTLLHRIRNWRNPHNRTDIHLAALVRRYGFDVGAHSYGRPKVRFPESGRKLTIGRYCSIADRVEILLGGNHRLDWASTYPFGAFPETWPDAGEAASRFNGSRGDVIVGSDVWLGSGATILSGVTLGHGAAVAARAVVTRDVPPYGIAAGNPARLIRLRFREPLIAALLETAWWELPDEKVTLLTPLLSSDRIEELIAAVRRVRSAERAGVGAAAVP